MRTAAGRKEEQKGTQRQRDGFFSFCFLGDFFVGDFLCSSLSTSSSLLFVVLENIFVSYLIFFANLQHRPCKLLAISSWGFRGGRLGGALGACGVTKDIRRSPGTSWFGGDEPPVFSKKNATLAAKLLESMRTMDGV